MKFIAVTVRTALIMHGYDQNNREIIETLTGQTFTQKLLALDRILSVSEQFLLVSGADGRQMYWEYQDGFTVLRQRLMEVGLLVG